MFAGQEYFIDNYEESRTCFFELAEKLQITWPNVLKEEHRLEKNSLNGFSVDLLKALPQNKGERLLIITAGLHGIEGYTGAAMQRLFVNEIASQLNPLNTGLVLVHAINPWGMKKLRRVNEHNVDLNRNFLYPSFQAGDTKNPAYNRALNTLQPCRPVAACASCFFYATLFNKILTMGPAIFRQAVLLGQYEHQNGLYYGGKGFEFSTQVMDNLFRALFRQFKTVVLLDMHTGYGPRYNMSVVNSFYEKRDSRMLQGLFDYPLVVKADSDEFYRMHGDMIDYLYQVVEESYPDRYFYGTCFEFGTYGDSFIAVLKSLKAMIDENCFYHHGAPGKGAAAKAERAFAGLFYPEEAHWRKKAAEDGRRAFSGILKAEGFIS